MAAALAAALAAGDEPLTAVPPGNRKRVSVRLAGDSSYPTGGYTTASLAAQLGMQRIDMISVGFSEGLAHCAVFLPTTQKLLIGDTSAAPLAELADGTNISTARFPAVVWGL